MNLHLPSRSILLALLALALWPALTLAQAGPPAPATPVPRPPDLAAVRARLEGLTEAQVRAMGYTNAAPECVSSPAGAMGFHIEHPWLWRDQFTSRRWDAQNPPILLLDASRRVVGIEWEAVSTTQPPPSVFGQTAPLLPGHPGPPEVSATHYMLHVYFKPNGMVLIDSWDPDLRCPAPAAAAPTQLPRTGGAAPGAAPVLAGALALALLGTGAALRRHGK